MVFLPHNFASHSSLLVKYTWNPSRKMYVLKAYPQTLSVSQKGSETVNAVTLAEGIYYMCVTVCIFSWCRAPCKPLYTYFPKRKMKEKEMVPM